MKSSTSSRARRTFPTARLLAVACASALAVAGPAAGGQRMWDGSVGNWDTDASWSGGAEPTLADSAIIDAGTVTVDLVGEVADSLFVGLFGTGTLNIADGGVLSNAAGNLGTQAGSTGKATVAGTHSTWTNAGDLFVGLFGTGTLDVQAGGAVTNASGIIGTFATGTATVTGTDSTWTNLGILALGNAANGNFGSGTLNVQAGGSVTNTDGYLGLAAGSTGTATVTGTNSIWDNDGVLLVGASGSGTLNVQAGASVSNTDGYIAVTAGISGTATVTGAGSTWTHTNGLYVGGSDTAAGGTGTLQVVDGGHVAVAGTFKIWQTATATLDGGTLSVGSTDVATIERLDFEAGTFNLTSDDLTIGAAGLFGNDLIINSQKTINVTNLATIEADNTLAVFGGFSSGGLTNHGDAIFVNTTIGGPVHNPTGSNLNIIGDVTFTGLVSGGGGIFGSGTSDFQGGFSPGDSPAIVTIEGSASFGESNILTIEIGGTTAGDEYDQINVLGSLTLGGTLVLRFVDSFAPTQGDVFSFINANSQAGVFQDVQIENLAESFQYDLVSQNGVVELTALNDGEYVPEPTSLALLAFGGLLVSRRRRGE